MKVALRFTALVAVGLAACNAILGNEASITYVGDAGAPGDRPDGFTDAPAADGATNDASAEADLPNADVPCDAAAFCSDFDPPSQTFPFGWQQGRPKDASVFLLDDVDFVTAPNALSLTRPGSGPNRWLSTEIDGGRPFDFVFDMNVRTLGSEMVQVPWTVLFDRVRATVP